jgi:hypothetical protein
MDEKKYSKDETLEAIKLVARSQQRGSMLFGASEVDELDNWWRRFLNKILK